MGGGGGGAGGLIIRILRYVLPNYPRSVSHGQMIRSG